MLRWRLVQIGVLCAALAAGCNRAKDEVRREPAAPPTTAPDQQVAVAPADSNAANASAPPATTPAEQAPSTEPSITVMLIDQNRVEFPAAKVRIQQTDGRVTAILYSDDPKDALDDKYRGNSFYFEMPLNVTDTTFDQATWLHRSQGSDRADTPYGIFLDGHRSQLQAQDVKARFSPAVNGMMKVELSGTFLLVDTRDDAAPTRIVPVAGWFLADPTSKH